MSFYMTILTRKFLNFFLLKLSYKNSCVKFNAFLRRNGSFFLKNEALRSESVKRLKYLMMKWCYTRALTAII